MICSDFWKLLIVAVVVTLISFQPISAGYSEILSGTFHACRYSACDHNPVCPYNYDILTQSHEGCSDYKQKNYCCPSGTGPQCFFTGCDGDTSCPENYRELDRTKVGCSDFNVKVYCCKKTHLPYCFDMTCPTISESAKVCPPEYRETRREIGQKPGCESTVSMRLTCCLHDNDDDGGYNRNYTGNTKKEDEDDGTPTFTIRRGYTNNYRRGMYSGGETTFAVFFKVLILLPIIIVML